jgi:hypothetical protein
MSVVRVLVFVGLTTCFACSDEGPQPSASTVPVGTSTEPAAGAGGAQTATSAGATSIAGVSAPAPQSAGVSGGAAGMTAGAQAQAGASSVDAAAGSGGMSAAGSGGALPIPTEKFSFFVTSLQGMRDLSKSEQGFGGDLRYGEATGLDGADKICTELAERALPGSGSKGWRAFLSTAKGSPEGGPTHAKDRIGTGPWYDRAGRLIAMDLTGLLQERPAGADSAIINDLPNERGEPNHTDTLPEMDDNHDVVTATNLQGMYDGRPTCEDFTSVETPMPMMGAAGMSGAAGRGGRGGFPGGGGFMHYGPGLGHSWPAMSGMSWMTAHGAPGCSPSVALVQTGPGEGTGIGNGGGYGGIYCFALMP